MTTSLKQSLLVATILSSAVATPALAQQAAADDGAIIVTAQRIEQDIQDVPISITVFDQEKLDNNNILNAKDLATFTPGVYAQTRFGNDVTTYTIRGFAQEQRTTATVGTYFAEVVAPRGNGVSQGGDGASPGALFDLQNVQVLKGPQGTLFGRNTTGGAVLLVPVKPKDDFEGYVEATAGNLNRWRLQGVVNLPISETFRIRLGVDRHKRDGYIKNIGIRGKHDDDMGSIDILALRGSAVWDISDNIENYTIVTYSESKGSGSIPLLRPTGKFPLTNFGSNQTQVNRELAEGFWTATNTNPLAEAYFEEFRVINRTAIDLNDSVTLTNIFGYSRLKGANNVPAFGLATQITPTITGPESYLSFVPVQANPDTNGLTANTEAIVEELRLNGQTGRLTWQGGLYYEKNSPKSFTGTFSPTFAACADIANFQCSPGRNGSYSKNKVWFETMAAYAQATYELTDQLSVTGGIRYTEDETRATYQNGRVFFAADPADNTFACGFPGLPDSGQVFAFDERFTRCFNSSKVKTSAPTWQLGVDYKPNDDMLLYAKYVRGYRQGSISPASPTGIEAYGKEKVDMFEVGAKTSWYGSVPGRFNIAGYYNDFSGQQLQVGVTCVDPNNPTPPEQQTPLCQTTTIINAGSTELYGIEADLTIEPVEGFKIEAAYSYNKTKIKSIPTVNLGNEFLVRELQAGGAIPLAVPHAFNATASWKLPFDESVGDITLSGTVVHRSSFRAVADATPGSNIGVLPKVTFGNANLSWKNIGGGPVDAVFYVTNITNEKMFTHINDQSTRGFVSYSVDEQRQYGLRIKYRFGGLAD
ncbi:MAG: TonB-dependent receptor [Novosphingobium sp.]|nr:TonB-dependent receptor [Novosphingobium sp.]MCP5402854.1 TonB-dependent receptor [Novosphingobium sp.]